MPKLAREFHIPRVRAYQKAIQALDMAGESTLSHPERTEFTYLADKLRRDQKKFIEKFNVDCDTLSN